MHILIVEDDKESAIALQKTLLAEHYIVDVAYSYEQAQSRLRHGNYSIILLDWNLGDGSGHELLKQLREEECSSFVIMITSESDTQNKASVLDSGADDYIVKPYSSIELLARIRAVSRRESTQKSSHITFGRLQLDVAACEITLDGTALELTTTEYNILKLLMLNPNVVLSRFQITEHIMSDFAAIGNSNLVDVHIKNLRKKLADYKVIKTVRGVGYTLKKEI